MKILDVPQSGSQAGTTASRNRFGQYRRTRAMPTQPRTDAQLSVRANLNNVSKAWGSLTDAQRLGWASYAAAHPRYDSLGQQVTLTGHQMFVSVNTLNLALGLTIQNAVPDGVAVPLITVLNTVTTAAGLSITLESDMPAGTTGQVMVSPPMSAGRSFNGDFRQLNVIPDSAAATDPVITKALYEAKFGALVAGMKIFYQIFGTKGGNLSAPFVGSAIIN